MNKIIEFLGCIWFMSLPIIFLGGVLLIFGLATRKVDAVKFGAILVFLGLVAFLTTDWEAQDTRTNLIDDDLQDEIDRNQ
jgi:hypothetical protein